MLVRGPAPGESTRSLAAMAPRFREKGTLSKKCRRKLAAQWLRNGMTHNQAWVHSMSPSPDFTKEMPGSLRISLMSPRLAVAPAQLLPRLQVHLRAQLPGFRANGRGLHFAAGVEGVVQPQTQTTGRNTQKTLPTWNQRILALKNKHGLPGPVRFADTCKSVLHLINSSGVFLYLFALPLGSEDYKHTTEGSALSSKRLKLLAMFLIRTRWWA